MTLMTPTAPRNRGSKVMNDPDGDKFIICLRTFTSEDEPPAT
jgi:hypothetical protein